MKKILILILLTGFCLASAQGKSEIKQVKVKKLNISENHNKLVYGSRLEPKHMYVHYSPSSGQITRVYVTEGDYVLKDQPLLAVQKVSKGEVFKPVLVTALSNGIVAEINIAEGEEIFTKDKLVTVADNSRLKTTILVSDKDISQLKLGDRCTSRETGEAEGYISRISLLPDGETGLFPVEVTFDKKIGSLFIGKFIIMELTVNLFRGIIIPANEIVRKYGKNHLYVVRENKVYLQEIETGQAFGKDTSITGGVVEGDLIVTWADKLLADGDQVEILPDETN